MWNEIEKNRSRNRLIAAAWLAIIFGLLPASAARGAEPNLKAQFLQLCDANSKPVEQQARKPRKQTP